MNVGEKNEFLFKIYLTYLRDNNPKLKTCFGPIKSVGFGEKEYKSCPKNFDEIYEDLNTNYWWNVYEGWRDNDIYELILEKYENYKARITDEEIKNIKKNCLSKNNYNNIYELVRNCYFWHSSWVHSSWAIGSKARAGVAEKKCIEGDCRNGNGTYTFANGDKYVGEFKDGKYHGQGTYTKSDGTVEKGIWENGKLVEPTTPKPKSG